MEATLVEQVERGMDELIGASSFLKGFAKLENDDQRFELIALGLRLRMELNKDGQEMVVQSAAYGLLKRYNEGHAEERVVVS